MPNDRWGEPIPQGNWTFSLAAIFRVVTGIAMILGWWVLLGTNSIAAVAVLAGIAMTLGVVAATRQKGGLGSQFTVIVGFFFGTLLLGGFMAGLRAVVFAAQERNESANFLAVVFGCYLTVAFPIVLAAAWLMLRAWLHLAAESKSN